MPKFPSKVKAIHQSKSDYIISLENIKSSLDNISIRFGCRILIDQEAFDNMNHDILLNKLDHYGIRGNSLHWFKLYLNDRKQFAPVNGHSSSKCNITFGIPQGSVLVFSIFNLYS